MHHNPVGIALAVALGTALLIRTGSAEPNTPAAANAFQESTDRKAGEVREDNGLKLKLIWCPPGEFTMGSPQTERDRWPNEDQVHVRLTRGFWLGQCEVTQGEWRILMGTTPWKGQEHTGDGADHPATYVSWDEARTFSRKLTDQERQAGRLPATFEYTLPTEAQWEYACRAGTKTRYSFGDDDSQLSDFAWWGGMMGDGNAKNEQYAHRVGLKKANPWGLRDMHGNVWEWCRDWYAEKLPGGADPEPPFKGSLRVERGGGWRGTARAAHRAGVHPSSRMDLLGFRVALSPSAPSGDAATSAPLSEDLSKEIAMIEALGGSVVQDSDQPGSPIVTINLIRSAKLKDEDLELLKRFPNLRELSLGMTAITDAGLKHISGLKKLTILGLVGTKITDRGLRELKGLQNLEILRLGNTAIGDNGLKELESLKKLEDVGLRGTATTEAGLRALKEAIPNLNR